MSQSSTIPPSRKRMLTFASGGWVIVAAILVSSLGVGWELYQSRLRSQGPLPGDGQNVESYGFDLSNLTLPRDTLVAAPFSKDGIPAMVAPEFVSGATDVDAYQANHRKFMAPRERVVGVAVGGEARAYALRHLNWHEVINDTVGGVPILVTYHPLCDSVVVFDRRVDGETLEFGVSGLLYNSNLLFYDRRETPQEESLWLQLLARAVSGPAAGTALSVLPSMLISWDDWRNLHPDTGVVLPDPMLKKRYRRNPYSTYFGDDELRFPVEPLPARDQRPYKSPIVVFEANGEWGRLALADLAQRAQGAERFSSRIAGTGLVFDYNSKPPTLLILDAGTGESAALFHAFWFAWYAIHGDATHEGDYSTDDA